MFHKKFEKNFIVTYNKRNLFKYIVFVAILPNCMRCTKQLEKENILIRYLRENNNKITRNRRQQYES